MNFIRKLIRQNERVNAAQEKLLDWNTLIRDYRTEALYLITERKFQEAQSMLEKADKYIIKSRRVIKVIYGKSKRNHRGA